MGVNVIKDDAYWMGLALEAARQAGGSDEVPVGAVVVLNDEPIAIAHNSPIKSNDPTAHAEVLALRAAARAVDNYRLVDAELFVTLEPCMMCAGAMLHARIKRLVFGATDPKTGATGGCFNWLQDPAHTHKIAIEHSVLEQECSQLLKDFFKEKRQK